MRKFMILGALVALVVVALAIPALAQHDGGFFRGNPDDFGGYRFAVGDQDRVEAREDRWEERQDRWEDRVDEGFFGANDFERFADFSGFDAQDWWNDNDWDDNDWQDDRNDDAGISQSSEQNANSGDVSQSFNVSGGGDNSNQCVGVQGITNTGNAQNQVSVLQYGSEADEFGFEDSSGASINVGGNASTRCDQQVNQSASAFGR